MARWKITADTSIRLGEFFGVSDRYFLDIQDDIDIRNTKILKYRLWKKSIVFLHFIMCRWDRKK